MGKNTKKIIGAFLVMLVAAVLVLGGFYMLNNKGISSSGESTSLPSSEIGKLKAKDLELKYPETPSEVVKLYWRLNKCMYNTSMNEKDFEALLKQLRLLYDEEFLASGENSWDNMLKNFQKDKKSFNKNKRVISSYTVEDEREVKYATLDKRECATLLTSTLETVKSKNTQFITKFMCRRDDSGKWKILGWEKAEGEDLKK